MKNKTRLAISLALLPALLLPDSCRRMDYDTSKGIDKEITLFEEEVTIPLGSTGEITLEKIVSEANGFLQQAGLEFKTDKDGLLYTEIEDYFGYVDAYSILYQIKDLTQPYDYALKNLNGSVGGTGAAVTLVGFDFKDQVFQLKLSSPIYETFTMDAQLDLTCSVMDWSTWSSTTTYTHSADITAASFKSSSSHQTFFELAIPDEAMCAPGNFDLKNTVLHLPAGFDTKIKSLPMPTFMFYYYHKGYLSVGNREILSSLASVVPINNLNLPLEQFNLSSCEVSLNLSNTLPIDLSITAIDALDEEEEVMKNVKISCDCTLAGGTLEKPGLSTLKIVIETEDETFLPDISGLNLHFKAKGTPGLEGTVLSVKQGICLQSGQATLRGGITLFSSKEENEGGNDNE